MEEGAQAPDWDSDETVIDGSVTESDLDEEELPWRRLIFEEDSSLRSESSLHPGINGIYRGMPSPEIQLGFKLRDDPQEQMNKNKVMPSLSEDTVLQQLQDEAQQNQALLQTRKNCSIFTVSSPQAGLTLNHENTGGPEAKNPEVLPHPEEELSEDRDSPEISLLSGIAITVSDMVAAKEKSLIEPEEVSAPNTFSEPRKEVTLTMTSEDKDEESSLETFVSALERLITPESTQEERLFEIMNDFDSGELMNPLSDSMSSISIPLNTLSACHRNLLENTKDDALPAELWAALNTLSEANVGSICDREKGSGIFNAGNEYLEVEPSISQTNEDCTQIMKVNFKSRSTPPFEQDSKLAELQNKHLSVEHTPQDPQPFELLPLAHQNVIFCEPLNNKGNSSPMENSSYQETPCMLRRSSRLEKLKVSRDAKHTDDVYKMPEKNLPKILSCEDQTSNKPPTENFRMQNPAVMNEGEGKNMHSSSLKNGKQIRKNEKFTRNNEKLKMNKISLSSINRRNIFGENLLYKAALCDDVDLVHYCIKKGGNVNQPSYAGWTALHEASVGGFYQTARELLRGGADVNVKGMYQITPLHDAVMNGHYKVAELLLLNGASPLFRSDSGKCALDEAKDLCMKRLLERYIPKHQKCLTSAQRSTTDPLNIEDVHQNKKQKFSSKNHIWFVHGENANRQKPEHVEVDKRSKEGLFINKEDVYECYQKDFQNTKFGKSKHKRSTLNQIYSTELRKGGLHNVKDPSTGEPKSRGRRKTSYKRTRVDDGDCNSRKAIAVSSSKGIHRLITHQQHSLTLVDLPEESCEPFSPTLSSLKNGLDKNIKVCSISEETHTQSLELSDSQEIELLEESINQIEAVSLSGLSIHKEIECPLVTTTQQPHIHHEQHSSFYKSGENSNSDSEGKSLNKWESCFLSFVKGNFDDDSGDSCISERAVTSKKVVCSTYCKKHYNYEDSKTNREEMDFQQFLPSEDHISQENELQVGSLPIISPEAVNFSDPDNVIISDQHIPNHEQCMYGTSFDHSHVIPEQIFPACTRILSTHEVSKLTSPVELFKEPQDYSPRALTPLMNQTDTRIVEKVKKKQNTQMNYTDKGQTNSSGMLVSIDVQSQVIETTTVGKRRNDLLEGRTICNTDFHSIDNTNKELTNIQREEKEISHKPDKELTDNIGDESTMRNCEEEKEKMDSEIQISTNIQEHKEVENFRKGQSLSKATYSEGWTPLHEQSNERSNVIVELLKAGANVNCENLDGILPLHDAVTINHLKVAEILLQHGVNPYEKDQQQKTTLDEADDGKMKELLKSCSAIEMDNRDENNPAIIEIPAVQSKRYKQCFCDDSKSVDPPSLSHKEKTDESLPVHQTISAILQDIEKKQEHLLEFEIRNHEDAEQYIEKMLDIKQIMDDVLARQKAERDDLAKKYRVSVESFKHGALREQLANLATRQKSLLAVAKTQKEISLKIKNYKNVISLSGLSLRKLPSSSEISSEKDSQDLTHLENSVQPQLGSCSPVSPVCGNGQEAQLSLETCNSSLNTNICLNSETVRREESSESEMNSKQSVNDCTLDGLSKSRYSDSTEKIKLPSQPIAFIAQAEYSQKESDLTEPTAKGHELCSPSTVTGTLNISETTIILAPNEAHSSTVIYDEDLSNCDPKRGNRKTASQQPHRGASEFLEHQETAVLGRDTVHQKRPYHKKTTSVVSPANDSKIFSGSGGQCTTRKPLNSNIAPKKKCMQIKDLISLGKINPGTNILEFKTEDTTHKASILVSGKIKVENGHIYQNPVAWLKDLLGCDSSVSWNYAWSKVTYLGKELLKYVSEEIPISPEPNLAPQQNQPCLPGISRESMQNLPPYLQINEILLISDQEFFPRHIMDKHWKYYMECKELPF